MSGTLNTSNYSTTLYEDFTRESSVSGNFALHWANNGNLSFGSGGVTLSANAGGDVGFEQSGGQGSTYGLYQVTATLNAGQGTGPAVLLWPSDNVWPGGELDLLESSDSSRQSGYATVHWNDNGQNAYNYHTFNLDLTQSHTYALDWEPGSLTYYIDGHELWSQTSNVPSSPDSFGAEVDNTSSNVSMTISSMSISKLNGGASGQTSSSATPTTSAAQVAAASAAPAASINPSTLAVNTVSFGAAATDVSGVAGKANAFTWGGGSLQDTIENFSAGNGDYIQLPSGLRGLLHQTVVGTDTHLSFPVGGQDPTIVVKNDASLGASEIRWV